MALTIENGSIIAGANSFASVAELRAFAAARNSALPDADAEAESLLVRACDWLQGKRFKGVPTSPGLQPLNWPRAGVVVDGYEYPANGIPEAVKAAQCALAVEAMTVDLSPTGTGREIIREKLDVIETQFSPGGGGSPQPVFPKVENIIRPFLSNSGGGLELFRL